MKKIESYNQLVDTLDSLDFRDFYINRVQNFNYQINFGARKGILHFDSIRSAAAQYAYDISGKYKINIDHQLVDPKTLPSDELVLQCIEVFDWGGVQSSNIIDALNYYRTNVLKLYLLQWKAWFEDDTTLNLKDETIFWSSGWTKVFSFMFTNTTIYDSRVAAYINYLFVQFYKMLSTSAQQQALKSISSHLISFNGTANRSRCVDAEWRELLGIKMKSTNNTNALRANKVASWFLRYLCQIEYGDTTQEHFRQIDKAMFMLGFDIKLIDGQAPFI